MSNLIPLEDAARMLGVSVDKLSEMRSNSEIFGYKDGASWKFKMQELERVADEFGLSLKPGDAVGDAAAAAADAVESNEDDFDLALAGDKEDSELSFDMSDSADIILDDDESSAEISLSAEDDDLELAGDDDFSIADDDDSAIDLDTPVAAKEPEELSFGSSDIQLAEGSGENLLDDEEPSRGDPSTGKLLGDDEDELVLSEDDLFKDELKIEESHEDSLDLSSDFESSDEDDIIIESDSSAESDALEVSEDSDISLDDSGLVELADDSDDMILLDEPAAFEDATQLGDDDFNLTPVEEAVEIEDGSQVIALDDAELYDEASATLLSPSDELEAAPMLTDDAMGVDDFGAFDTGAMDPGMIPGTTGALPESPYTSWQIASLALVAALLGLGGIIAYDLARNLWLPEDQIITGGLLPSIVSLFGG